MRYFIPNRLTIALLFVCALIASTIAVPVVMAQDIVIPATDPLPGIGMEQMLAIVTALSPFVVWLFKLLAGLADKHIPKFLLPFLSGGLAMLGTYIVSLMGDTSTAWYIYVLLALASVGLREFNDRIIVKPVQSVKAALSGE